jgi:plastocyanin
MTFKAARALAPALAAMVAAVTVTGCGNDDDSSGPLGPSPKVAVSQLQEAFDDGDDEQICALITKSAQLQAGSMGHGTPKTCERDVSRALGMIDEAGGWDDSRAPKVVAVGGSGDAHTVTLALGAWRARVPFVKRGDRWRLNGFFGTNPEHLKRVELAAREAPFPPAGAVPVGATTPDGRPCPKLSDARFPKVSGGCVMEVSAKSAPIRMLTPLGDFKFADCAVDYTVLVDAQGRTFTRDWEIEGLSAKEETGCSDVNQCIVQSTYEYRPWKGRIRGDGRGGFVHHTDMCMRTCVGLFVGELVMRLVPDGKDWRVEPTDVGESGYRFAGDLQASGDLHLRRRGPATVEITDDGYEPDHLEIEVGDRVVFVNRMEQTAGSAQDESGGPIDVSPQPGPTRHDGSEIAHATRRGFATHSLFPDERQTVVFEAARRYDYTSTFDSRMRGTIVVKP